jgi:hypothetical protein
VQQVAVEPVAAKAPERVLAGLAHAGLRRVRRQNLGHQEDLVAPPGDGFADDLLGTTRAIHLGGVDMGEPEIEPAPQRRDGLAPVATFDVPGSLADGGDRGAAVPERLVGHGGILLKTDLERTLLRNV